ncbi:transcriptional adapter 2-beta [Nematocida sp. LUAm3]|nr:transcriptional adapter 2-beta [Nematocida sp. LUAm3]KAI5175572.1 transcriptional adapter 2-beta [Nematocida sp. LUAm2]KAI5178398.1 transcriptional adapter 2-beta [Nematocida sp. LUAm1]
MVVTHSKTQGNACIIRCDGCLSDITSFVWMNCAVCSIDICPLCFVKKVEISQHTYGHPYRVVKNLSFTAEFPEWRMLEELLFIDGLVLQGVGNWKEISMHIGRKSPEETKAHFCVVFRVEEDTSLEGPPVQETQSNPFSQEISGYMPLREDFELEYNNEAEHAIKDMSISKKDTILEKEMKEALLDSYKRTLDRRKLFRYLALKRRLIEAKANISQEKTLCSTGKDLLNKIKPLFKIMKEKEFNIFFKSLYLEIMLKKKIKHLSHNYSQMQKEGVKRPSAQEEFTLDLFSKEELLLCDSLNISPNIYLLIKETAVINQFCPEKEKKPISRLFQGLSEQKVSYLLEYFTINGWIQPT